MPSVLIPDPWNGGVAQLGEHLLCKQGVVGSSPITSTDRRSDNRDQGSEPMASAIGHTAGEAGAALLISEL